MINKKRILNSDIRHACGDTYFERGYQYFEQDRILSLEVFSEKDNFVILKASTSGSGNKYYEQQIRIDWKDDFNTVIIDGDCACPMDFNCKHVAAVCLQYMHLNTPVKSHTPDCLNWLDNLEETNDTSSKQQEFIAYILVPGDIPNSFALEFFITKINKKGLLNKGRKTTLNNIRYSYGYSDYLQAEDEEIGRLLYSMETNYQDHPRLTGSAGFLALSHILQTGRLFWKSHQASAIQSSKTRNLEFIWDKKKHHYKLNTVITPAAEIILTDPVLYFDAQQMSIGRLETKNITLAKLKKILTIPLIPAEHVDEFSLRLTLEHPAVSLPAPKKVELTDVTDTKPIARISLFGTELTGSQYVHFLQLNYIYNDIAVSGVDPNPVTTIKTEQGVFRIQRNIEEETFILDQLISLGFASTQIKDLNELVFYSPSETSFMDSTSRWSEFIQEIIPQLSEQGWQVEINNNFKLNFQQAEDWQADIEESNNDWFEMNFHININGQAMPLLPLIMPVLEQFDLEELPEMLSIPIEQHSYVNIPSAQLKPFLEIVYELFDSATLNEQGSLQLSRFNVAALADIDSHCYGIFSLNGGKTLIETGKKLRNFQGIENIQPPQSLNATLRDYQQQGLNWLQFLRDYNFAGILADDMGLGKTVQTLSHLLIEKEAGRITKPCLIIAPTSLMGNWRREAERFTPALNLLTLQGTERKQHFDKIKDFDIVLTTYPLLPRDKSILLEHDYYYLILDEAQIIKNPKSQAALTVREIQANHRLCLTGTPMENHLGELWAQFDFLMPGFLGDSAYFKKSYRTPIEVHGDEQQRERLSKRLQPFMLRRNKQQVATELPAKTEIIRSVPLHEKQAALYESIRITMEKKVREAIANKGLARSHITILDALLKLRQTCCDPRTLSLEKAQKVNESAKLDLLMEMLPEQLEEGRRILVFSQFTKMIALIEKELNAENIAYSKLTGQTKKRDEAIDRFKNGDADVFLISLKAGGVGLNLTEADTVIIFDPWWNPAVESQAADRAHRIGQDKPVFVYKLLTENTVEEKILAMQEKKRALADSVYKGGKKEKSMQLSSEDLTELFKPLS